MLYNKIKYVFAEIPIRNFLYDVDINIYVFFSPIQKSLQQKSLNRHSTVYFILHDKYFEFKVYFNEEDFVNNSFFVEILFNEKLSENSARSQNYKRSCFVLQSNNLIKVSLKSFSLVIQPVLVRTCHWMAFTM